MSGAGAPDRPAVSAFICSYNHARFLPAAIDSVLAQSHADLELLVVDDGSRDGSLEVARSYEQRDARVRVLTHPGNRNRGISASANLAVARSVAPYLAWLGSDDLWYPDKLAAQVARLEEGPELGLVYGYAHPIDANGRRLPGIRGADITRRGDPLRRLIRGNRIPASTVVIRRAALEQVGGFDEALLYSDWELWLRLLGRWRCACLQKPLAGYRLHSDNVSVQVAWEKSLRRHEVALAALQLKAVEAGGRLEQPRTRALIALQLSAIAFCRGDLQAATTRVDEALAVDPGVAVERCFLAFWLIDLALKPPAGASLEAGGQRFGDWFVACLRDRAAPSVVRAVDRARRGLPAARRALRAHREGDHAAVRRAALSWLLADPSAAAHPTLRALLGESFLPTALAARLRRRSPGPRGDRRAPAAHPAHQREASR